MPLRAAGQRDPISAGGAGRGRGGAASALASAGMRHPHQQQSGLRISLLKGWCGLTFLYP